ncbi:mycofactocin oligosaccharide methyltransferase MftM, partial [Jatrophihabitans endophyticus]|uniref:mycofactocin oligosaccharide methyltransferase MftM n=1 Tax=Jatrophihabitans endophyticus TaxID=1206085 RepID=UPI0019D97A4F
MAAPLDTMRSCPDGRYDDDVVHVRRASTPGITARPGRDGRIEVLHRIGPAALDDELGSPLAEALAPLTDDHEVFARAFTGVVLTSQPHAASAWDLFYRNSLARIRHRTAPGYSTVYRHALELLPPTSVVDLGCSFGFLALHLAARGVAVTACDVDPGTTALVRRMSRRLGHVLDVRTTTEDHVNLPDGSADAVAVLHVLEHVGFEQGAAVLGEALRIARRRVVVAVPYEPRPTALFGHVRSVDARQLDALGSASGWTYEVHEHFGGWLV